MEYKPMKLVRCLVGSLFGITGLFYLRKGMDVEFLLGMLIATVIIGIDDILEELIEIKEKKKEKKKC